MFTEETCTNCPTPHPAGRYKCDGCNATFPVVGVSSTFNVVIEAERAVFAVTKRWAYCPLCGSATKLKGSPTKRLVCSLEEN